MSHTLNAALVGYGFAGKTFHAPFLSTTPGLSLSWVVSRDAAKVQADLPGCRVGSLEEVLSDETVDLVVIATPNDTHAPLARQALLAGKHVVIDKPFALDLTEAQALVELAEKQQRLLSIFHNRRWDGDFLTVRRLIAEGTLGQIAQFESHFDRYRPEVRQRWREAGGPGSGLWFDLGPHVLDQVLQLFRPAGLAAGRSGQATPRRTGGRLLPCGAGLRCSAGYSAWQLPGLGHHAALCHSRQPGFVREIRYGCAGRSAQAGQAATGS